MGNHSFFMNKQFLFYGKSRNSSFWTMLKVKICDIYLKFEKKFKKTDVHIDSFLPWTQNLNCSPRHCVRPQISTFGLGHIYLIRTFDNAKKQISCQKSGCAHIGPLSQQYS